MTDTDATTAPLDSITGVHHVRISVSDLGRSRAFYEGVLGLTPAIVSEGDPSDPAVLQDPSVFFGGVIYAFGGGLLGLRPVAPGDDRFDEDRVGLDHVSFTVPQRDALDEAVAVLDRLGVAHEGVKDLGGYAILEFRDPDGIALELTALTG